MEITMFSTVWCGYCRRLKRQMDEAGISYQEVDLDEDPTHSERIMARTGGFRTVPTLDIGGELFVNPTITEVRAALTSHG